MKFLMLFTKRCAYFFGASMLLLLPFTPLQAQQFVYPTIVFEAPKWQNFVPEGWEVLQYAEGDLNEDKARDYAVIVQYKEDVSFIDAQNRPIVGKPRLLFIVTQAKPRSFYRLVEQSNTFILSRTKEMPGDPFRGMRLERGFLFFDFALFNSLSKEWDISSTYTFRFELARFYLFGVNYHSTQRKTQKYEDYSFHFLNSQVSIRKGTEEEGDGLIQSRLLPRMMLKHFGSFAAPFTWEILKGIKI